MTTETSEVYAGPVRLMRYFQVIAAAGLLGHVAWTVFVTGRHFDPSELWIVAIALSFGLDAAAHLFLTRVNGLALSIWSTTLLGGMFVATGVSTRSWLLGGIGAALIIAAAGLALFEPYGRAWGDARRDADGADGKHADGAGVR